jgi:hypothetical protein
MFKNFLILEILLISYSTVFAQLTINTSGHVIFSGNTTTNGFSAIGSSPSSSYRLRVEYYSGGSVHTGIYSNSTGGAGSILNYGIQGRATSPGYTNYGVYGYASGGGYNWAGYFSGNVYTTGSYQSSDERIKKNIKQLDKRDMLSKIEQLKPVSFQFLSETELREKGLPSLNTKGGNHIGLLAQDVEKIFPEFVTDVSQPIEDENGETDENPEIVTLKAINYQELSVALLAAVQELQAEVQELKAALGNR